MGSVLAEQLALQVQTLLDGVAAAVEDLTDDELNALPVEGSLSVGFHGWHAFRTADNIVHFVFYRERPVWAEQGLAEAWGFPRNEQGTGMLLEEGQGLRFPSAAALASYGRDVAAAVVAKIEAMDDEFLLETTPTRTIGEVEERPRVDSVAGVILSHLNQHLGQMQLLRHILGRRSPGAYAD